jgi:hypothetical protein
MKTKRQIIEQRMRRLETLYKVLVARRKAEIVKQRLARKGATDDR